jgi:hypothetical protein
MMPFSDDRRRCLESYRSSWSSSREWSFAFCIGKARRRETSRPGFRHSLGMPPTACEASRVGVCTFDKGASFWMMNPGLEGRQLIFLIFRFCRHSKTTFSLGLLTFQGPQSVVHDNCEPFARLASLEISPFAVDSPSVDRAAPNHKSPEMRGVAAIARDHSGEQIPHYCHGRRELIHPWVSTLHEVERPSRNVHVYCYRFDDFSTQFRFSVFRE